MGTKMTKMTKTNSENSIGIHFIGLEIKERSTFDRVIAFNITHGLKAHISEDVSSSDIIVITDRALPQLEQTGENKTLLVITNDPSAGNNIQVSRPLLITRVMKALENAIKRVHEKPSSVEETETDNKAEVDATSSETAITDSDKNENTESQPSGHHALVIDDSAAIRKQLELELRDAGITADFAESGEQALEKIKEKQFDLIFLDIIMPGIDGYETCKAMRSTAEYKKTPIIMLSGKTSPLDEVQGVIAGATTYLTKPVKSDMLQETLNRVTKWIVNFSSAEKVNSATV